MATAKKNATAFDAMTAEEQQAYLLEPVEVYIPDPNDGTSSMFISVGYFQAQAPHDTYQKLPRYVALEVEKAIAQRRNVNKDKGGVKQMNL